MESSKLRKIRWKGVLLPLLARNSEWYDNGRTGDGRIDLVDEVIPHAAVSDLAGAKFTRCDLTALKCDTFADIELVDCIVNDAEMSRANMRRATLRGCSFQRTWMGEATFEDANLRGGDWRTAYLECSEWIRTTVDDVDLGGSLLADVTIANSTFTNCTFWMTNVSRRETRSPVRGRIVDTRFVGCDFRHADISNMQMHNVVFERCRFHGVNGAPAPGFDLTLIEPDFAGALDRRQDIDPEVMLEQWRAGSSILRAFAR